MLAGLRRASLVSYALALATGATASSCNRSFRGRLVSIDLLGSVFVIGIASAGTRRTGTPHEFAEARARFEREGYLTLAGFIDAALLALLLDTADRADFYERSHEGIGAELCATPGTLSGTLELASNDPVLFGAIDDLTGCGAIGCFEGRVYRLAPASAHFDSWHSDVGQDRLIAMSVNLSRRPFEGGLLQIRKADSSQILSEVANTVAGDAVIFRIHPDYRHRVGTVTGQHPRTAWAGWFRTQPAFENQLRARLTTGA